MKIEFKTTAKKWNQGFPIGNGHMGAMVINDLPITRLELSENTFFSGEKSDANNQNMSYEAFGEMRTAAKEGKYDKVHNIADRFIGVRKNYGTNLPVGQFLIDYGLNQDAVTDYLRSLNIMNGEAECQITSGENFIKERFFISHDDNIMIHKISLNHNRKIRFSFQSNNSYGEVNYDEDSVRFQCFAYEMMHCDNKCGVRLNGLGIIKTDGICQVSKAGIEISNASEIYLYIYMVTDYHDRIMNQTEDSTEKYKKMVQKHLESCTQDDYMDILMRHKADMESYMNRIDFQLECDSKISLMFQYGRYLLLSSSREDSMLPAHLQGIWNDNVACQIGWTCDMHLDINTQMNYWLAEVTALPETTLPLFCWIDEMLSKSGEKTAKESYGLDGWVAEIVSNAWGYTAPYWASPIAPCPTGGVWILTQMWEHYQYSENKDFLKTIVFPLLRFSVVFFNGYIFREENTQWYTSGPSISPENSFLYNNQQYQISNGCTYEILMIRELFQIYMEACTILNFEKDELYNEVSEKIGKLLPYRITKEGTIAEWSHDLPESDSQHRHTSHLLGLYPFSQISREKNPDLFEAAKKTVQKKVTPPEQWEDTGWARSMLILYEARFENGNKALWHIEQMLTHLLEPNFMIYHPPTRGANAFDHVYELDGNTGLTTAISEMLLQSQNGILHLLPALPDRWSNGKITGLRARGNIEVNLYWKEGELTYACLQSNTDILCTICYKLEKVAINLMKNVKYYFEPKEKGKKNEL